jgi:cystathionine beta-lyase
VIIQRPVYYPFTHAVEEQGRQVSDNALVEKNGRWEIDFEDLQRRAENPKAKLMFLCNPHNPVSRVFSREELTKIAEICLNNKVLLVSDEIHSDFVFSGYRHIPVASLSQAIANNTITTISPSKTFNTAGLNIAAAIVFDEDIAARLARVQSNNRSNPLSAFGLDAYIAAYGEGEEYVAQLTAYLEENARFLNSFLKENAPKIKLTKPEGTYLMWLDCRELGLKKQELDDFFTHKAAVALDAGWWFGENGTGFMRMNIACPQATLLQGLNQIVKTYRDFRF